MTASPGAPPRSRSGSRAADSALASLARRAARRRRADPALTVVVVPGIMGSQLGLKRAAPLPDDILWIDPIDFQHGRLRQLLLEGESRIVPLGVSTIGLFCDGG